MLAHKLAKSNDVMSQEALLYRPDERNWIHLNIEQENHTMELMKNTHGVHLLGKLYFVGKNSTFTFDYESQSFQMRHHLVHQKDASHLSFVYIN